MSILFRQEVATYLREAREREPVGVLELRRALERLDRGDDTMLTRVPHTKLSDDTYFLGIGGFIVTVVKRPNGDLLVTDVTKGMLTDENVRHAG